jgi:GNAT superfamily N-acetyltransferase
MPDPKITLDPNPDPALRDAILKPLVDYNFSKVGQRPLTTFALFIREPGSDEIVGGLWARSFFDWAFVELLFVPEAMRGSGLGQSLLAEAEALARTRGCIGIYLDTFSFQARGFYEKQGYGLFGTLDNYPDDEKRFFLSKRLTDQTAIS